MTRSTYCPGILRSGFGTESCEYLAGAGPRRWLEARKAVDQRA